jgi:thiol-disulfide isomerase/thioredoxin
MSRSYSSKVRKKKSRRSGSSGNRSQNDGEGGKKSAAAPIIFITIVLLISGAGVFFAAGGQHLFESNGDEPVESGDSGDDGGNDVPDASTPAYMKIPLYDVEGGTFTLERFKGKVILVDMFAMWCSPCRYQIEELTKVVSSYGSDDLAVVSVDVDESEQAGDISEFRSEYGATWRFSSYSAQFSGEFTATAIPTLYMIDRDGNIVNSHEGAKSASELSAEISPLI